MKRVNTDTGGGRGALEFSELCKAQEFSSSVRIAPHCSMVNAFYVKELGNIPRSERSRQSMRAWQAKEEVLGLRGRLLPDYCCTDGAESLADVGVKTG